ncbi:error-prone DNA polymerase [Paraglaciecola sp. 25GB23A]|uniref:error-prone DNA polymerase n=1 Tax=Paraglaciecola sp. 25GB23A TaxID=3156068 RepID=UPI0032AFB31C
MGLAAYAELFCQSNFSFLQGASHPQELVQRADFLAYQAIAITDECSVAGVVRAYTAIKDQQLSIKLIVGSLFKLNDEFSVILLCPNRQAYAELCRIITNARRRAVKGQYQLESWDLKSSQHCFALWLPSGQVDKDHAAAKQLQAIFKQRLWIGVQRQLTANEHRYIQHCRYLQQQYQLPITACGGVLMHDPDRLMLQHALTAIGQGKSIASLGRELLSNSERSLRCLEKINRLYPQQWLQESVEIAQRCTFDMSELRYEYPAELVPQGKTATQYLRELVLVGMHKRFAADGKLAFAIKRIIAKELKLIREMQYEYFFLTIYDIVQFAKLQHILYQGRGSAANSVVCYCLEITAVDPRQIDVLFERFISKERQEEPDIDVDFEHQRREEIIQYIYQKYGRERTAIAATVVTYRQKSAIREIGKAMGIDESQLAFFIKNIDRRDVQVDWQAQIAELGFAAESQQGKQFIYLVNEIKGFPRHLSQHVGGFIISAGPMYHLVPIENAAMAQRSIIQWDKDDLGSLGLLKVDILALGMLSAIRKAFELVNTHYQHDWSIAKITKLGDDPQVFKMIQQADTVGVFQIESRAQMSMLPRLKPKCYYDLVVQIAIVRPGPIQGDMVHPYLKRRDGVEKFDHPSKAVEAVLKRTNGVPIFQEQVIKMAMVAAGFTGGEADQLRRAMASWKKNGELLKFREKLINGMLQRGYEFDYAERIFNQIKGFGEYGFPESHSASFAVLAYVSSWLKYYYPQAFYVALLNSWPMGFYPPAQLVQDAQRHQIQILPVCINASDYEHKFEFHNNDWAIRLGFSLVKGLKETALISLLKHRPEQGFEHVAQIKQLGLARHYLEALASANAFSCISDNRYAARWSLMDNESDLPLFRHLAEPAANYSESLVAIKKPSASETLIEDYSSLSLTLGKHPIALLREAGLLPKHVQANQLYQREHQKPLSVIGVVVGRQRPGTSKGVTFISLEDDTGCMNVIVWLATARAQKQAYLKSKILKVNGILERGDGGVTHIIAGKLEDLSHLIKQLDTRSRDFH